MKIAICAIIRNENLYLREWVEHHKNIGFDHIILYDNNNPDGEYPHQVIGDYIMDGFVEVNNIRGYPFIYNEIINGEKLEIGLQATLYNKCRLEYKNVFDWIAFIDVDEFITIGDKEPQNIHDIFDKYKYDSNGFEQVVMSWYTIGDDGRLNFESKPVQERFQIHRDKPSDDICDWWVKSIVKTNVPDDKLFVYGNEHAICDLYTCGEYGLWIPAGIAGEICQLTCPLHNILYVKHYFTKSLWEHVVRRIQRNDIGKDTDNYMRVQDYKTQNGWSDEHQKIFDEFQKYVRNPLDMSNIKIKRNK